MTKADDANLLGYDAVAEAYAERFLRELDGKPFDQALLRAFADLVRGRGKVVDIGCGPGHVGAFLRERGLDVEGVDGSGEMVRVARRCFPAMTFVEADFRALPYADSSLAGLSAAYAIVHFTVPELAPVFAEAQRVLAPGGVALFSFHVGDEPVAVDELLGKRVSMTFRFLPVAGVRAGLEEAGLEVFAALERKGDAAVEHASLRAYLFARKPTA
ncbi:MAG: class I SAM-dependent methyltransferase [Polyangiaceae bacterium]|nr:class I SAM-dependent methyltransferase [Polyangiaceae bacterium]